MAIPEINAICAKPDFIKILHVNTMFLVYKLVDKTRKSEWISLHVRSYKKNMPQSFWKQINFFAHMSFIIRLAIVNNIVK